MSTANAAGPKPIVILQASNTICSENCNSSHHSQEIQTQCNAVSHRSKSDIQAPKCCDHVRPTFNISLISPESGHKPPMIITPIISIFNSEDQTITNQPSPHHPQIFNQNEINQKNGYPIPIVTTYPYL